MNIYDVNNTKLYLTIILGHKTSTYSTEMFTKPRSDQIKLSTNKSVTFANEYDVTSPTNQSKYHKDSTMEQLKGSPDIVEQGVEEITSDPSSDHDSIQDTMEDIGTMMRTFQKKFNKFESWLIQNVKHIMDRTYPANGATHFKIENMLEVAQYTTLVLEK